MRTAAAAVQRCVGLHKLYIYTHAYTSIYYTLCSRMIAVTFVYTFIRNALYTNQCTRAPTTQRKKHNLRLRPFQRHIACGSETSEPIILIQCKPMELCVCVCRVLWNVRQVYVEFEYEYLNTFCKCYKIWFILV